MERNSFFPSFLLTIICFFALVTSFNEMLVICYGPFLRLNQQDNTAKSGIPSAQTENNLPGKSLKETNSSYFPNVDFFFQCTTNSSHSYLTHSSTLHSTYLILRGHLYTVRSIICTICTTCWRSCI